MKLTNPVKAEKDRLNAAALRVLAYLQARPGQWVTNVELSKPDVGGLGGVRRKWELEQDGHVIEKRHVKGGQYVYRYVGLKPL